VAPDGTEWFEITADQPPAGRRASQNFLHLAPGPTHYAKRNVHESSALSAFKLLVSDLLLDKIHGKTEFPNWCLSKEELLRFIALVYARGVLGQRHLPIKSCWDKTLGSHIFSSAMPRYRFLDIMKHLRFDSRETRSQRLREDNFALASEPWNIFISNSRANYNPSESVTADEQLYPTNCKCSFIQFMPNKPDKFGIKFWVLADAKSKYCLNAFPYCGKNDDRPSNQPKNRRDLPPSIRAKNEIHTTKLYRNEYGQILTYYQANKNKNVLLLTTMHSDVIISDTGKRKPETVLFYNKNKVARFNSRFSIISEEMRDVPLHNGNGEESNGLVGTTAKDKYGAKRRPHCCPPVPGIAACAKQSV
ncbi:hypothetical protein J437_LFUL018881, partial [Ladona fulva]